MSHVPFRNGTESYSDRNTANAEHDQCGPLMIHSGKCCGHPESATGSKASLLPGPCPPKHVTNMSKRKGDYLRCTPHTRLFRQDSVEHRNNVIVHATSK